MQPQRPYNHRRHNQLIAYRSPPSLSSSQLTPKILSRPHAMHPNLDKLRIDPPVLLLLIVCIVALLLWLSYGVYTSMTWYIHRFRTVRYRLEENLNPDILMGKLDGRLYPSEEKERRKFGQIVKWFHPHPTKTHDVKLEYAWKEKKGGLLRHQSVSSGSASVIRGDDGRRAQDFAYRRRSAV